MLLDAGNKFHRNQAGYTSLLPALEGELVTTATNVLLSGTLDELQAGDMGAGEPIYPFAKVTNNAAFNPGTSAQFQVIGADTSVTNNSYASLVNPVICSDSGAILTASLGAGAIIPMPPLTPGIRKRYYYMKVTIVGAAPTTGAIVAMLVDRNTREQLYLQQTGTPTGHNL